MPTDLKVVLVSTSLNPTTGTLRSAHRLIGLETISMALKYRGFTNVSMFPQRALKVTSGPELDRSKILAGIAPLVRPGENVVFGLTAMSDDYKVFRKVSALLRAQYPGSTMVAGGPHFQLENLYGLGGKRIRDPVETTLLNREADAVVVGNAKPFIDLICDQNGKIGGVPPKGLYYRLKGDTIIGSGTGKYPETGSIPYVPTGVKNGISTITDPSCANRCGFCCINKGKLGFSEGFIFDLLQELAQRHKNAGRLTIDLNDSNPFEKNGAVLRAIERFMGEHGDKKPAFSFSAYLDPSLLLYPSSLDLIIKMVGYGFVNFFLGRDTLTEDVSKEIELNYRGKPKEQRRLDAEKDALIEFIQFLKSTAVGGTKQPAIVKLSYIFTPFDTEKSLIDMVDEMIMFRLLSDKRVSVLPAIDLLIPYPGTKVREKHLGLIKDTEDYAGLAMGSNPWDPASGPGAHLADYFVGPFQNILFTLLYDRKISILKDADRKELIKVMMLIFS